MVHGTVLHAVLPDADLKVDAQTANILIATSLLLGTPFFLVFGSLSDRIGRKPIIMAGLLLAALTYFPIFRAITHYANPALADGAGASAGDGDRRSRTTARCSSIRSGTSKFTSPCDVAKAALVRRGVPYSNEHVTSRRARRLTGRSVDPRRVDGDPVVRRDGARRRRRGPRRSTPRSAARSTPRAIPRRRTPERDQQADGDAAAAGSSSST